MNEATFVTANYTIPVYNLTVANPVREQELLQAATDLLTAVRLVR